MSLLSPISSEGFKRSNFSEIKQLKSSKSGQEKVTRYSIGPVRYQNLIRHVHAYIERPGNNLCKLRRVGTSQTILGFKSLAKSVEEKAVADMATQCAEELKILLDSPRTGWPTLAAADEVEAQFAEGIAKFEQLRSLYASPPSPK
jgi:hypothetical protein